MQDPKACRAESLLWPRSLSTNFANTANQVFSGVGFVFVCLFAELLLANFCGINFTMADFQLPMSSVNAEQAQSVLVSGYDVTQAQQQPYLLHLPVSNSITSSLLFPHPLMVPSGPLDPVNLISSDTYLQILDSRGLTHRQVPADNGLSTLLGMCDIPRNKGILPRKYWKLSHQIPNFQKGLGPTAGPGF